MISLAGKRILVLGVASAESIAWATAQGLAHCGAEVHISYQQRFRSRVMQLLNEVPGLIAGAHRCDVTNDAEIQQMFQAIGGPLHSLIHGVGYAPPETFGKPIYEVTPDEFSQAALISAHSLLRVTRFALPFMVAGSSITTLTYLGGQRVVPGYRMMGIAKAALEATVRELAVDVGHHGVRVNAVSAGPVATLSAMALPSFSTMLEQYPRISPLHAPITTHDVAKMCAFLCSDLSDKVTGQVLFVDAGYSALGAYPPA